ncbi:MAPEG family protein [Oryzifoliimicrobium ureilyticus]|uniref:MAPEG family protein n=1 Tax=Oryzifoliimicrobium ureilyticus TaxID=3113724 RepID=UPI00307662F2
MKGFTGYEMFWPIGAHAALVYGLYGVLRVRRMRMFRAGRLKIDEFRENRSEPTESRVVNHCIANQFELPILFYVCCILTYITEADNVVSLALAWLFIALRYAQAYVHITSNNIKIRSNLFMAGFAALGGMWLWLLIWMATSP